MWPAAREGVSFSSSSGEAGAVDGTSVGSRSDRQVTDRDVVDVIPFAGTFVVEKMEVIRVSFCRAEGHRMRRPSSSRLGRTLSLRRRAGTDRRDVCESFFFRRDRVGSLHSEVTCRESGG